MTIPTTQTAFGYIKGEKQIQRFDNVPVPQPKSNEVLLKIEAAGLCMSDPHILIGGPPPSLKGEATKFVMGHEIAGLIVQVGSELTGDSTYKVGARFALTIAQSCGFCKNCRAGKDNACTKSFQAYGLNEDGGFQQYLVIRNLKSLLPIPKALDYATAAVSTDSVLTPFHCIQKVRHLLLPTTKVVVFGLGGLGMNAVQILKNYGCKIVACDVKSELEKDALNAGADEFYTDINKSKHFPESFDICFDFVGIQVTSDACQKYVKAQGKYMIVGLGRSKALIKTYELARREVEIIFNFGGTSAEQMECMEWIAMGKIKPILTEVPFKELPLYLKKLVKGEIKGRVVFRPSKL